MDQEWPELPLDEWRATRDTLHMWTQVAGKVCLALTPLTNHFWNIAFRVTASGFVTPTLKAGPRTMTMTFDFVEHQLVMACADGAVERIALQPQTVADFYRRVLDALSRLGVSVHIWPMPVEVPDPIRFDLDTVHRDYDAEYANRFWKVLLAATPILEQFRSGFIGKCSPVHFFWGSFDLAVTRFSGRPAPPRPTADAVTREAYSHEVISHGFWSGGGVVHDAAFYAYAAPEPPGFADTVVAPAAAYYSRELSEFILPYEAVRTAKAPAEHLAAFLTSTYESAAALGGWDRAALERV